MIDDDWVIEDVSDVGVRIRNTRSDHHATLAKDHVHHYTSDLGRSADGLKHGFLTLTVQPFLQGNDLWVRPTLRPGEPLKPPRVEIIEKWVDLNYPAKSGIQKRLEAEGSRVVWCQDSKLAQKVDLERWEVVVEPDANGVLTKFRTKSGPDQTLIKKC